MSRDKLAADVAELDPRARIASDSPDCFLCGKTVRAAVALTVETDSSFGLSAHPECCNGMPVIEMYARYWKAVRAIVSGERETPNPAPARVRGFFQ